MKREWGAWAMLAMLGTVAACSSTNSGDGSDSDASAGGSATGGSPINSGGTTTSGSGGASGGASSGSGTGGQSSSGGDTSGTGGITGLGGTKNDYGTIVDSPVVEKLLALTSSCTAANKIASDTGKFAKDSGAIVHVCGLPGASGTDNPGGAIYWSADMDIDCDGKTTANCPGPAGPDHDPSYYNQTAFSGPHSSALTSENTPYVVIPEEITNVDQQNGGNIVAIIYDGQIEFAVFGDTIAYQNGDDNEPIGEASVRAAKGLGIPASPATGGVSGGVTYIAFTGEGTQPADMEDLAEVQALGEKLLLSLLQNNQ